MLFFYQFLPHNYSHRNIFKSFASHRMRKLIINLIFLYSSLNENSSVPSFTFLIPLLFVYPDEKLLETSYLSSKSSRAKFSRISATSFIGHISSEICLGQVANVFIIAYFISFCFSILIFTS